MDRWDARAAATDTSRIAVLAGGDEAAGLQALLSEAGFQASGAEADELLRGIEGGTLGLAVVTFEALGEVGGDPLSAALARQPAWSDFPFVLLADRDALQAERDTVAALGNVILVERPLHKAVLCNAVRSASRSRERQREAQAYLIQRETAEGHLRHLTATLESRVRERMTELRAANERLLSEVEERHAAEARLRESEELYRYTVELTQQMAWTANPDGTMVTVSPRFYELTGADPELPPHKAWVAVVHPEDLAALEPHWSRALRTGDTHLVDFRMRVADGSYRVFRARAAPRRDEAGAIVRWYGYTEDIHERRQSEIARRGAEERLRESEELYRYTIELSQGIVWTAEPDGTFRNMTSRYWELTGMEPGSLPRNAIHPDDRDATLNEWAQAIATGQPHHAEYRLRLADGTYRHVRARAAPRRDDAGRVLRWYGMLEDIEEQKKAEQAREEAEERYRLAAMATEAAIWDLTLTSEEIRWTTSSTGFFGYPGGDVLTSLSWWEERVHPDDRPVVVEGLDRAIAGSDSHWAAPYRFRTADGSYTEVYDQGFIIRDAQGVAIRVVGAIADVTELRQSEAEIRRVQAELIHVSRLSAMGTMASALAHELNQPLMAVSSYIRGSRRLLEKVEHAAVDPVRTALEHAEEGALRAGHMVRKLRELVARGNVTVRAEELPKLIQDANLIGFVDEQIYGATHRVELDPAAKWVHVDRIQIQQVLINLIRNALQAMEGQAKREVLISTRALSRTTAEVSVADTGCGIPAEVREALFSPFQSSKAEGMGIGLSISRTIVEAHGGKIWAEDRDGGGTVFRFTLRMAEEPAPGTREQGA